ncbi:DUF6658 family protein [Lyngbya sp. CCY1209]|uniref:DUF6658 family protein n=1 Tax=Lyngbya sp. CCY1209 TaxID=2886103 RepID=UPI002D1FEBCB|nr:DUF6658 family protein [Lyngbya sp. CCY1209]MEB3882129.1 hypothetical protein [Lyngbya sp. CCY1209]
MKRLYHYLKSLRLRHLVTVFLAGTLLVISTACGTPETKGFQGEVGAYPNSEQPARTDASRAASKANQLSENARKNIDKVNSPEDFAEEFQEGKPLGERVKNLSKDVGESFQDLGQGVAEETPNKVNNLKENTADAAKSAKRAAENASNTVKETAEDTAKSAKRTAEDATTSAKRAAEDAKDALES